MFFSSCLQVFRRISFLKHIAKFIQMHLYGDLYTKFIQIMHLHASLSNSGFCFPHFCLLKLSLLFHNLVSYFLFQFGEHQILFRYIGSALTVPWGFYFLKFVGMAVYNIGVLSVVGVICVTVLYNTGNYTASYVTVTICTVLSTEVTLFLIFVPKVCCFYFMLFFVFMYQFPLGTCVKSTIKIVDCIIKLS